jgi:uncharacterized protein YndB with AHSA1/START domain
VSRAVEASVTLADPPDRVWELVMDPTLLERWVTTHDSLGADAEPGPAAEGDSFTQRLRLAGKGFDVRWRVVEAERPRYARWVGEGPARSTAEVGYRFTPSDGGTHFEYSNRLAIPGGLAGKIAGRLLSGAPGSREARRSLENLRRLLEHSRESSPQDRGSGEASGHHPPRRPPVEDPD